MTFLWPFSIAIFVYQRVLPSGVIKPRWLGHPRTSWKLSSLGESWNQMVATSNGGISHYKCSCNVQPLCFPTRFAIYGDIYHQYTPNYVSIYTSTMDPMGYIYICVCVFLSQGMFHYRFSHLKVCFRCCSHRVSAGTVPGRRIWIWMRFSANFIAQWI